MVMRTVPGTTLEYELISFDKNGDETTTGGAASAVDEVAARIAGGAAQEVIVVSHGWNNDSVDAPRLYDRWLGPVATLIEDRSLPRPLIVAVHWPSKAWGREVGVTLGGAVLGAPETGMLIPLKQAVEEWAARLGDTDQERAVLVEPLTAIFTESVIGPDRDELPPDLKRHFDVISAIVSRDGKDEGPWSPPEAYRLLGQFGTDGAGLGGADRPGEVLGGSGGWKLFGLVRQASFWKMKKRARVVGTSGVHAMIAAFRSAAVGTSTRLHLVGHSFGCIVVSAAVLGDPVLGPRTPVSSLTLLQGAMSMWSLDASIAVADGAPGYFSPLLTEKLVDGPLVVTWSRSDHAVGTYYPLAAAVVGAVVLGQPVYGATGAHGARGLEAGVDEVLELALGPATYALRAGTVYNVDASAVISDEEPIEGSHNDIARSEVAELVLAAVRAAPRDRP
ncbi:MULTISPECIES: hypothetical protein [unclassified Rathayibacter]|uniref:hypothetical protein n=1 Tax=unclassified Rathayibacter TaxID=2609250 RepID=UPI0006F4C63B|nr:MULTISPECIES: hypothetical protein [unclassified Rathayibacter]KQQ05696.1 hypothetical protein ASF42_03790 [Rathayibacter sp. Leaf294]KQS13554.1 hypothetical protein ASG06_03800 [Rathayibacter sp. Leaf185]